MATRENFKAENYAPAAFDLLKLEDGIRIHEDSNDNLVLYALDRGVERKKPVMLVVGIDMAHAEELQALMEAPAFFDGRYKRKVITVHSGAGQGKEEKDEIVEKLLTVESLENPVEIVIHVNMLKEGWDVTNLYTIVPAPLPTRRLWSNRASAEACACPMGGARESRP